MEEWKHKHFSFLFVSLGILRTLSVLQCVNGTLRQTYQRSGSALQLSVHSGQLEINTSLRLTNTTDQTGGPRRSDGAGGRTGYRVPSHNRAHQQQLTSLSLPGSLVPFQAGLSPSWRYDRVLTALLSVAAQNATAAAQTHRHRRTSHQARDPCCQQEDESINLPMSISKSCKTPLKNCQTK